MSDTGFYWHKCHNFNVPPNAVQGGTDTDGSPIYVGRTPIANDLCPCKVVPARRSAYAAYGSKEHSVHTFEVLCERQFRWVSSSHGHVPPNAVCGGHTGSGEKLYIGRVSHNRSTTVGKVHPSHRCLYISYDGKEISFNSYEVLVRV